MKLDRTIYMMWHQRAGTPREPCQAAARHYWKLMESSLRPEDRVTLLASWKMAASGARERFDEDALLIGCSYFQDYGLD